MLYLEVLYIRKHCQSVGKSFPLEKARQAYAFFERVRKPMIVLRGGKYEPYFTPDDLERGVDLWIYGKYEDRLQKFLEWLNEKIKQVEEYSDES